MESRLRRLRGVQHHTCLEPIATVETHLQLIGDQRLVEIGLEEHDLLGGHIRNSERPHQTLPVNCRQRPGDVLRISQRIGSVQQQHVDHVGAQAPQALLDAPDDGFASQVIEAGPVALRKSNAALRLKDDALTQLRRAGEDLTKHRLRLPVPIDIGVIKGGKPTVQRRADRGLRLGDLGSSVLLRVPRTAKSHAPVQQPILYKVRGARHAADHPTTQNGQADPRRSRPSASFGVKGSSLVRE
jgi:hypothetical protein